MSNHRIHFKGALVAYVILSAFFIFNGCGDKSPTRPSEDLPDTTETRAPMEVQNLHFVSSGYTWLDLAWETAGDSSTAETEFFDLRYSLVPINVDNWDDATEFASVPEPDTVGAIQTCRVIGLRPGIEYHFAMKSGHTEGGLSSISNPALGAMKRFFREAVPLEDVSGIIVFVADIDGDGKLDLVTMSDLLGSEIEVHLGDGVGGFARVGPSTTGIRAYQNNYAISDLDGDGDLDIASFEYGASIFIGRNLGGGVFAPPELIFSPGVQQIASGDFDSDGDVDLVFATPETLYPIEPGDIGLLVNDGTGFTWGSSPEVETIYRGVHVSYMYGADLDGDGRLDLVFKEYAKGYLNVIFNNGFAETWDRWEMMVPMLSTGCYPADMNGDGLSDFAAGWANDRFYTLLNDGGRNFITVPPLGKNSAVTGPMIALDFNGDGFPDIVSGVRGNDYGRTDSIKFGLNNGDGTFTGWANYIGNGEIQLQVLGKLLFALDYDGDGDLDLVVNDGDIDNLEPMVMVNDPELLE